MACQLETIEFMKDRLKTDKKAGKVPLDFYTLMKEIFNRVMLYHQHDSFDRLEEISQLIKKTHLKIKDPLKEIDASKHTPILKSKIIDCYIHELRRLIKESVLLAEEDEWFVEKEIKWIIDDFPSTMKMFEWAGISFGEAESFRIYKAMKRLAKISGATHLRFWGKYLGRQRDYFVIEGKLPYSEESKTANDAEERGKGLNSCVYWVTDDLLNDWIQLPDSEPQYITAARNIKHVVTGDLNADLNTNPVFPGKERHFLRAQIARISHTTSIVPKDYLQPHEENERNVVPNEEFSAPSATDLNNTENWVHQFHNILLAGRAEHIAPNVGEEELEEAINELEGKDPFVERLKSINEDLKVYKDIEGAWNTRLVGNIQQYQGDDEGTVSYVCWEVKSLRWKGATTLTQNGRWASLYIGYGIKTGDVCFKPTIPEEIMNDPEEVQEQPEPTPFEAPAQAEAPPKEGEGEKEAEGDQEKAE